MGIGVPDVQKIWKWYREHFGMDIKVFEDAAEAPLMTQYTGGVVQKRTASLALSMDGGGGFEIWQYKSRNTEKAEFDINFGDLGIYSCKIKSRDVQKTYDYLKSKNADVLNEPSKNPAGQLNFFVKDPNNNIFQVVEGKGWFMETKHPANTGGVAGAIMGVSDIDKSLSFYQNVLGYETVIYDEIGEFECFSALPNGENKTRRVLLQHKELRKGPFAKLLGPTEIELIEVKDYQPRQIFENRMWGDWGFIHLCFDVQNMKDLQAECEEAGHPFTVDSGETFEMGEAGGRFSYVEDPDGALIEFVETHKVPIMKKLGWYVDLTKKEPGKSLPTWMLRAMRFSRVKD